MAIVRQNAVTYATLRISFTSKQQRRVSMYVLPTGRRTFSRDVARGIATPLPFRDGDLNLTR